MSFPTSIELTKAERTGLEEVRDHGWCARTDPVVTKLLKRRLMDRSWNMNSINPLYKLTAKGKRALGIDPEARPI